MVCVVAHDPTCMFVFIRLVFPFYTHYDQKFHYISNYEKQMVVIIPAFKNDTIGQDLPVRMCAYSVKRAIIPEVNDL